jgi:glucan phosphoethanolaminetransferase (alkaline phosphatase superfamily)
MLARFRRLAADPGRRRQAALCALALALTAATLPMALYWAKDWLWPEWFHRNRIPQVAAAWLVLLALSLAPVGKRAAAHLLWALHLLQWVVLFRAGSWTLGLLGAVCCAWLLSGKRAWRLAMAMLLSSGAVLAAGYERLYGPVSADAVAAILQTNADEAGGFVFQHLSIVVLAMFAIMLVTQVVLFLTRPVLAPIGFRGALPFAVVLMLFGSAGQLDRVQAARSSVERLRTQAQSMVRVAPADVSVRPRGPLDVVLILGESNTRWHWQLYGYPGQTNPALASMRDRMVVFTDAVSSDSHTVQALSAMFYRPYYDAQQPPQLQALRKVSVLDALGAGNVDTAWLSAQAPFGPWAAAVSQLAKDSRSTAFFNRGSEGRLSPQGLIGDPDLLARDAVIGALRAPATGKDRLIVQHMLAPHFPYCKYGAGESPAATLARGPGFFGEAPDLSDDLACYDRAIRFTDGIIEDVMRAADGRPRPTVVMFVPDHGEAPEEGTTHNNSAHSARHVEIPFVIHFNDAARQALGSEHAALVANAAKPVMNSWVGELLLDLFHVSVKGLQREAGSLLDPAFHGPPRTLFRDDLPVQYDQLTYDDRKDPLELTRLNLRQVRRDGSWTRPLYAHRVDSQAKALEAKQYFDGIEMDLMFDPRRRVFDIYHPPAARTSLTLDMQLDAVADKPALALWFDFKNPPLDDSGPVLKALEALDARWHLKGRTVLELPAGAVAQMHAYSAAGWRVSYYIPPGFVACGEAAATPACAQQAERIVREAQAAHATYLSFDYGSFPAVSKLIVPRKGGLQLLSWTWVDSTANGLSATLGAYPRLDGLIIPFKSKFSY